MLWFASNPVVFRARLCPSGTVQGSATVRAAQATGFRVRCVVGAVGCGLACFALLCFPLQLLTGPYQSESRYGVCGTPACRGYSRLLAASLSEDVNPCDDFDRFVCGRWRRSRRNTTVLHEAVDHLVELLGNELRAVRRSHVGSSAEQTALDKAAAFYHSCIRVVEEPNDELSLMRTLFLHANVTWPRPSRAGDDLFSMLVYMSVTVGFSPLFNFYVTSSAGGRELVVEHTDILEAVFRKRRELMGKGTYWSYYCAFAEKLGEKDPDSGQFAALNSTEEWVLPRLVDAFRQPGDDLVAKTLSDGNLTLFSEERLRLALDAFLSGEDRQPAVIRIRGPNVWSAFSKAVNYFGERAVYDSVGWWMVQYVAPWLDKDLAEVRFGETNRRAVTRRCITFLDTLMGLVTWTPAATPWHVRSVVCQVMRGLNDALALRILTALPYKVQFLKAEELRVLDYKDFPDLTNSMGYNMLSVLRARSRVHRAGPWTVSYLERAFSAPGNILQSPGATLLLLPYMLNGPVFEYEATAGVNYGALGSLVAAALLRKAASDAPVQEALTCFRTNEPTLADDAWRAATVDLVWLAWSTRRFDTRLEGLSDYSESETYFMLWCFLSCSTSHPGLCNVALRRSGQFARTFGCGPKARMNPSKKCALAVM